MRTSQEGMRALWISLLALGVTAAAQAIVVVWSGSVALLSDTAHNAADALTAVPLGVAFLLGRRMATRRYTYGFGRAEDLAGILIVAVIAGSAALAGFQAIDRLLHPADVRALPAVAVAGNELVARYRIRVGRRIGSAALVADGLHVRHPQEPPQRPRPSRRAQVRPDRAPARRVPRGPLMARESLSNRQARREDLVARHADRRAELKRLIAHPDTDPAVRQDAVRRLVRLPRDSSPVRLRNRDVIDGRPRGVLTRFGLSRVRFREMALRGELPGIRKASW